MRAIAWVVRQALAAGVAVGTVASLVVLPSQPVAAAEYVLPNSSISLGTPVPVDQQPGAASHDSCNQLHQQLDELAAAGERTAACVEIRTLTPEEARSRREGADRSISEVLPLPQPCWDHAFINWVASRNYICRVAEGVLTVLDVQTGMPTGEMTFWELDYQYMDPAIDTWAFQIELIVQQFAGTAAGSSVFGTASCTLECIHLDSTFPPQPVTIGLNPQGEAFFTSTIPETGPLAFANSSWTYRLTNPNWVGGASNPVTVTPPWGVRCDSLARPVIGCVIHEYPSTYTVSISGNAPNYARHISNALSVNLPGDRFGLGAAPLHRLTNSLLIQQNRSTACPSTLTRPPGFSCDEYPFASTHEGAFTGGGTRYTFDWCQLPQVPRAPLNPDGYTACMIPIAENSSGGGTLGAFYNSYRIIEGEAFYVGVTP